jgi:hypothetical protein
VDQGALIPGPFRGPQKRSRSAGTGLTRVRYVSHKPFRRFSLNTDEPRSRQRESDVNVSAGDAPVRSTTEARQGVTGHNVRYILGFGVLAIIIAFAVVYGYYFHA